MPTPVPTPEYTPPESEESAHESGILATPERTPTPSVTSEEPTPSDTKEEEKVFEPINEELPKEEQTIDQVGWFCGLCSVLVVQRGPIELA